MKTRKLNRGLVLGAALLVGLAGFVTFDYINFKGNKQDIQNAVEAYLNEAARASTMQGTAQKEEFKKVLEDNWGYNEFYEKNFMVDYVTASDFKAGIDSYEDKELESGLISECNVRVSEVKVSKAGPNLAAASVSYSIAFKGKGQAHLITLNGISDTVYDSDNFMTAQLDYDLDGDRFKDLEYSGNVTYDDSATFYLEYEGGTWKIVAAEGYTNGLMLTDEDGNSIDLDRYVKGESAADDEKGEADGKEEGSVKIKLPDGTVIDVPEGEDIPDISQLPEGTKIITDGEDKKTADDDSSREESSKEPEKKPDKKNDDSSSSKADEKKDDSSEEGVEDLDLLDDGADQTTQTSSEDETVSAGGPGSADPITVEIEFVRIETGRNVLNGGWR